MSSNLTGSVGLGCVAVKKLSNSIKKQILYVDAHSYCNQLILWVLHVLLKDFM